MLTWLPVLAGVVLLGGGPPAAAAEPYARAYADRDASWAEASTNQGGVCDNDRDGHGVRGEFRRSDGTTAQVGDGNGAEAGCGHTATPSGVSFTAVRVCVDREGCSGWVQVKG